MWPTPTTSCNSRTPASTPCSSSPSSIWRQRASSLTTHSQWERPAARTLVRRSNRGWLRTPSLTRYGVRGRSGRRVGMSKRKAQHAPAPIRLHDFIEHMRLEARLVQERDAPARVLALEWVLEETGVAGRPRAKVQA